MSEKRAAAYIVEGMSCGHCAASVSNGVTELDGVTDVALDVGTGRLEVTGHGFGDNGVRDAIEEAGYRIAGRG